MTPDEIEEKHYCEICDAFYVSKQTHDDIVENAIKKYEKDVKENEGHPDQKFYEEQLRFYKRHEGLDGENPLQRGD